MDDATDSKIKLLAEEKAFGIRKLTKVGDSFALILPKFWVQWYCTEIDGNYYLKLQVIDNELVFSPITSDDVKDIRIKEKQ